MPRAPSPPLRRRLLSLIAVLSAVAVLPALAHAQRIGPVSKVLIEDENGLDVEEAFLRPPRTAKAEFGLTTGLQLSAPLGRAAPVGSVMFQAEGTLRHGPFSLVSVGRMRIDSFAAPLGSNKLFFHQLFAAWRHRFGEVKLGKVMGQLGRVWDYGLYGPLLANEDFKLTPDLGLSIEGQLGESAPLQMAYALQYFPIDGRALSVANPKFFTSARARRRNISTLRLVPIYQSKAGFRLGVGLSGQIYQSTSSHGAWIWRAASDVQWDAGPLEAFVELGRQSGADIPSGASVPTQPFNYVWAGAQIQAWPHLSLRHHVNIMRYEQEFAVVDILQQPGVEYTYNKHLTLVLEGAFWTTNSQATSRGEKTLYLFAIVSI